MSEKPLKHILEAALLAAGQPLSIDRLQSLFAEHDQPGRDQIKNALDELAVEYAERSIELKQVASGYRIQVREDYSDWVSRLWSEKPSRYSRALLETLALIAYRQPITRGEIEDIRGVSVSTNIIKTLQERDWIKVVGHRDVPGKPAMYGTTREFLDYFNLKTLDELPTLAELRDIETINAELDLEIPGVATDKAGQASMTDNQHAGQDTEAESDAVAVTDSDEGIEADSVKASQTDEVVDDMETTPADADKKVSGIEAEA